MQLAVPLVVGVVEVVLSPALWRRCEHVRSTEVTELLGLGQ